MAPGAAALPEPDQAKASGPTVWLDMDQQALDDAYDQSKYALNRSQIVERYASNSDIARERLGAPRRIAYGPTANEALDLYPAASTSAPISIFVHGGAWQRGLAKNYAFAAELFVHAGAHHVVLDFINVIEAGGDLMPMADQVRGAIAWVYRNAASFGGDPNRIHLYGHSSGAHLGGVAMVTDWPGLFDLPADVIKTGLLCSGMYDLRPVRLSGALPVCKLHQRYGGRA
jgi:arylformamidase